MSFGFSVGDFLAVLALAKDLTVAMSDTKGVPVELQQLKTMLDSLQKAINNAVQVAEEWNLAHPNPSNKVPFRALVGEHETCKMLLDNFREGSEKYLQSILNGKPKGYRDKMKREWAKMMWYMFHSDDAAALHRALMIHVMAINMHSEQLRWYVAIFFPQEEAILTTLQPDTQRHRKFQFIGAHSCGA
jgi:hypothetical protein